MRQAPREEHVKAALLSAWFFATVAALWLLKPVRVAVLLANLGAKETPYVRIAAVVVVGVVVALYSLVVNGMSRVQLVRAANVAFAILFVGFWFVWRIAGPAVASRRPYIFVSSSSLRNVCSKMTLMP